MTSTKSNSTPKRTQMDKLTEPKSALAVMATRFNVEPQKLHTTLKATVFKGASDEEMMALVMVANEHGLNPLTKEIYAFPSKGGGITPVVSVDGWTSILNRHRNFDGISFAYENHREGHVVSGTATIHVKGRSHPVVVTEFMQECAGNSQPWKQYPRRMLRHKALIQGARIAFGFSGIYDHEEAEEIVATAEPKPVFADEEPAPALFEVPEDEEDQIPGAEVEETKPEQKSISEMFAEEIAND